jgi:SAM-dependent methyltransferase
MGTVNREMEEIQPGWQLSRHPAGERVCCEHRRSACGGATSGPVRPERWSDTGPRACLAYTPVTCWFEKHIDALRPVPRANCSRSARTYDSEPPICPGVSVSSDIPRCTAAGHYPAAGVDLTAHRRDWEDLARVDPLWAVLSDPSKPFGNWEPEEFFASGERDIAALLDVCARHGLPRDRAAALDFGSGAGRLTRALSMRFDRCVGCNISQPMVDLAREFNADRPRCTFAVDDSDDLSRFEDASFDFVVSHIALQHVPGGDRILGYIREFVRVLRAGGAILFQLPSARPMRYRLQPARRLYGGLRSLGVPVETLHRRLRLQPMRESALSTEAVLSALGLARGRIVELDTRREETGVISAGHYVTR